MHITTTNNFFLFLSSFNSQQITDTHGKSVTLFDKPLDTAHSFLHNTNKYDQILITNVH